MYSKINSTLSALNPGFKFPFDESGINLICAFYFSSLLAHFLPTDQRFELLSHWESSISSYSEACITSPSAGM